MDPRDIQKWVNGSTRFSDTQARSVNKNIKRSVAPSIASSYAHSSYSGSSISPLDSASQVSENRSRLSSQSGYSSGSSINYSELGYRDENDMFDKLFGKPKDGYKLMPIERYEQTKDGLIPLNQTHRTQNIYAPSYSGYASSVGTRPPYNANPTVRSSLYLSGYASSPSTISASRPSAYHANHGGSFVGSFIQNANRGCHGSSCGIY